MFQFYPVDISYLRNLYYFDAMCHSMGHRYSLITPVEFDSPPNLLAASNEFRFENKGGDYYAIADFVTSRPPKTALSFVNSSMIGPISSGQGKTNWPASQQNLISQGIQLVGDTIHQLPSFSPHGVHFSLRYGIRKNLAHVQTGSFTIGPKLLADLVRLNFFAYTKPRGKLAQVRDFEIRLTDIANKLGYGTESVASPLSMNKKDPYDIQLQDYHLSGFQFLKSSRAKGLPPVSSELFDAERLESAENRAEASWGLFA